MASRPVVLALGSQQPAKRAAVERIAPLFWLDWQLVPLHVPSSIPEQPLSDEETALGALERAQNARRVVDADFGIGIESGVAPGPFGRWYVVSWAVVVDRDGHTGIGGAERFPLPEAVAERVLAGLDLARAIATVLGSRVSPEGGTVAVLSGGRRERSDMLAVALLHALIDLERQIGTLQVTRSSAAPGGR